MTVKDIINYDQNELKNIRFVFAPEYEEQNKYFEVKIHQLHGSNKDEIIINIRDCSSLILYNNEKKENIVQKTVNATVNHELRNPLNSIVAFNHQNKELLE